MGAYVTLPYMINTFRTMGFHGTICGNKEYYFARSSISVWSLLFALSKIPELVDTYFIVLQKRPLIFLHWYHHISVMIYGFYQTNSYESTGAPYMMMNYVVHSAMYTYYTITATGYRFPRWVAQCVTTMQLTQMILGLIIVIGTIYFKATSTCEGCTWPKLAGALAMYVSYFWLFATLYTRYFRENKGKKHKSSSSDDSKPSTPSTPLDASQKAFNLEGTPTSVAKDAKSAATSPSKRSSRKI
jgi:elongation of very long chain fatty acids protein 6